jgi:predicted ATPase/Tfp pilus assembly protein PilF
VIQLKALGGLRLESTGFKSTQFTQPKPLLLLTYLAVEGSQYRKHLAELFWQDGNRMKSLGVALLRLRQGLGEGVESGDKKAWTTVSSDVKALLEALDKGQWQRANELYTGAFLEGVALEAWSSELEEWVYSTREYLAERVQHALLNLAEDAAQHQDFARAGEFAERAYKLPGLNGTNVPSLKSLYLLLCAGNSLHAPEVRKEAEGYGVTLQLTTQEAREKFKPEIKSSYTLPVRGTSFVGRDEELAELATLLNKPSLSLLTLLGPAGVGKTRLALQLAHEQQKLNTFKDGVYFIPLDALSDSSHIPPTLLSHFGLTQQGKTEPLTQLADFLAEKNILLVLDNFEHLSEGSSLLSNLLGKCPKLILLVTSRERLNLEEEQVFTLEGLPFATMPTGDATLSDAVQLFNERAQQVLPHFDVDQQLSDVIKICQLVEGLPLGIELAASWVRLMSCKDIAAEIEKGLELLTSVSKNIPERHRSLKAAFEQSWKLLTAKEQDVLRKLSVFIGGFRREAASEVAGATIPILASLVDKSLLRVLPNGRYDRHPLLYQFTKEKLLEQPDEHLKMQENHARYYLSFTELADQQLQGKDQVTWFGRLDEELDNLREALGYLETKDDVSVALNLATALGYFWNARGYYAEGAGGLATLLNRTNGDTVTRAKALFHAGRLNFARADYEQARVFYEQSVGIAKNLQEKSIWANALMGLGQVNYHNQGDPKHTRSSYESSLELARDSKDKTTIAGVLFGLGAFEQEQSNFQQSRTWLTEAESLFAELGNIRSRARVLNSLANIWVDLGESDKARPLYLQCLELMRSIGDGLGVALILLNLGNDAGRQDDEAKATAYFEEGLRIFQEHGDKRMVSYILVSLGNSFYHQGDIGKAQTLLEESLSIQRAIGETGRMADVLKALGNVFFEQGELEKAYQCYQESLAACRKRDDRCRAYACIKAERGLVRGSQYPNQHVYEGF